MLTTAGRTCLTTLMITDSSDSTRIVPPTDGAGAVPGDAVSAGCAEKTGCIPRYWGRTIPPSRAPTATTPMAAIAPARCPGPGRRGRTTRALLDLHDTP